MRRHLAFALCGFGIATSARAGEIIFVDPAHEKGQSVRPAARPSEQQEAYRERLLDDARLRAGRGEPVVDEAESTASSQARRAREYLDEMPSPKPVIILQSGQPPTDAAKARQAARAWSAPQPNPANNRCQTQNTVGGIEGNVQGHTVIQANTSGVNVICK